MKKSSRISLWLIVLILSLAGSLMAQSTGTIRGVVKDPTGAILPGVSVTLTNKATQQTQTVVTSEVGGYVFPALPPGQYSLAFELPGFKKLLRDNLTLNVTEIATLDVSLEVGELSSEVTVSEQAPLIQAETAELGRVVEQVMITGVPLSSRNFTQILGLSAGVTGDVPNAGAFGRNSVNYEANGARPWENTVTMNGIQADNVNSLGFDDANDKTGIAVPNPDAIQEFKVQMALYDAGTGRQGGANVQIVTKTGTNTMHGSAFDFFRNSALNANDFFANANGQPRGVLQQNQAGFTYGGPIRKDKDFYFVSYQYTHQTNGVTPVTTILPVLGNRTAAGLGALYGGKSGLQGGVAVARDGSNINPIALALLNATLPDGTYAIPGPQTVASGGLSGSSTYSLPSVFSENQFMINLDHSFSNSNKGAAKVFYSDQPWKLPFESGGATVPGYGETDLKKNISVALSDVQTFTPNLLNEVHVGYSLNYEIQHPIEPLSATQFGITRPVTDQGDKIPLMSVSGGFTIGPQTNNQQTIILHTYELSDTVHYIHRKHDIRLGADLNPTLESRVEVFLIRGTMSFSSFPDFLLGMSAAQNGSNYSNIASSEAANGLNNRYPRYHDGSAYVQDDYRVTDRLTLNLGLRWQYYGGEIDKRGRKGNFDLRRAYYGDLPPQGTLDGFVVPNNVDLGRLEQLYANSPFVPPNFILPTKNLMDNDTRKAFSPRFGFAWRPLSGHDNLVMRGGYGIFWSAIAGTVFEQESFDPWLITVTAGGNQAPNATFQNPYTPLPPPTSQLPVYVPLTPGANRSFLALDPTVRLPYTQQWSWNWQYGIRDYVFELGYSGSKTTRLIGSTHPNQALLASPNAPIHDQTTNSTAAANIDGRALTLEFLPGAFTEYGSYFDSNYNAMEFSVKRQFAQNMSFIAAYTLGHGMDDVGASTSGRNEPIGSFTGNFYDRVANKASSDNDRRHRISASYLYQIPGTYQNRALQQVLSGWGFSGVTTLQTGKPFSITDGQAGTIYGVSSRAQFAPGMGASNAALSGRTESRLKQYFNTSAFNCTNAAGATVTCAPSIGNGTDFGNSGRNILRGPGQANFDMSLNRKFRVPGHESNVFEFRAEFFNVFNHPQFANPSGTSRSTASTFGQITSSSVAPRIGQLALKYQF